MTTAKIIFAIGVSITLIIVAANERPIRTPEQQYAEAYTDCVRVKYVNNKPIEDCNLIKQP